MIIKQAEAKLVGLNHSVFIHHVARFQYMHFPRQINSTETLVEVSSSTEPLVERAVWNEVVFGGS